MYLPKFRDERGFTLIETMATLFLLGLIVAVVATVTLSAGTDKNSIAEKLALQNELNKTTTSIDTAFHQGIEGGVLTYDYTPRNIVLTDLLEGSAKRETSGPITGLRSNESLALDITGKHEKGETLTIKSAWRNIQDETMRITLKPKPVTP